MSHSSLRGVPFNQSKKTQNSLWLAIIPESPVASSLRIPVEESRSQIPRGGELLPGLFLEGSEGVGGFVFIASATLSGAGAETVLLVLPRLVVVARGFVGVWRFGGTFGTVGAHVCGNRKSVRNMNTIIFLFSLSITHSQWCI